MDVIFPMCSHYQAPQNRKAFVNQFKVDPPEDMGKHDVWPGYPATFIRKANPNTPSAEREAASAGGIL